MSQGAGRRLPCSDHKKQPWRVHELAQDFELDVVWEYPIEADESKGETFSLLCEIEDRAATEPLPGIAESLIQLRFFLHKLGLNRPTRDRSIPGCRETSLRDRIKESERVPVKSFDGRFPFRIVYDERNERLLEVSNSTVHALLHIGFVQKSGPIHSPVMAVYVKPRGFFGRAYMALIYWFRVLIVYPALMQATAKRWEHRRRERLGLHGAHV